MTSVNSVEVKKNAGEKVTLPKPEALKTLEKLAEQFPEIGIEVIRHIFIGKIKKINIAEDGVDIQKIGTGLHHNFGIENGYGKIVSGITNLDHGIYLAEISVAQVEGGIVTYYPKCDAGINMIPTHFFPDVLTPFEILNEIQTALDAIKINFDFKTLDKKIVLLRNDASFQFQYGSLFTNKDYVSFTFLYRMGNNLRSELQGMAMKIIVDKNVKIITVYPAQ